jgi:hypothetical protein
MKRKHQIAIGVELKATLGKDYQSETIADRKIGTLRDGQTTCRVVLPHFSCDEPNGACRHAVTSAV